MPCFPFCMFTETSGLEAWHVKVLWQNSTSSRGQLSGHVSCQEDGDKMARSTSLLISYHAILVLFFSQ